MEVSLMVAIIVIFPIIFFVCTLIPEAFRNDRENQRLKDFPKFKDNKNCKICGFPFKSPNRYITDFSNPLCRLKYAEYELKCQKCNNSFKIAVDIER